MFKKLSVFFMSFFFLTATGSSFDSALDMTKLVVAGISEKFSPQDVCNELNLLLDKIDLTDSEIVQLGSFASAYERNKYVIAVRARVQKILDKIIAVIEEQSAIGSLTIIESLKSDKALRLDVADLLLDLSNLLKEGAIVYKNYLLADDANLAVSDKLIAAGILLRLISLIQELGLIAEDDSDDYDLVSLEN